MTGQHRTQLIVVSGLPGTGKSTLADALGAALAVPVLSVDPIEGAITGAGIPRSSMRWAVWSPPARCGGVSQACTARNCV